MKIKKLKFKQLLKLHLLKSRIYEYPEKKTNLSNLKNSNLDQVLVGVKKVLHIIFQYNQTNKHILFIGLPLKLEFKISSLTRHVAVSNSFNIQGFISNNNKNSALNLKNSIQIYVRHGSPVLSPKLLKKPDLIVLFDHPKSSAAIILEAWIVRTPVIAFLVSFDTQNLLFQNSYFVNGNFKNILASFDKNILFVGLNFLFKNLRKTKRIFNSVVSKSNSRFFNKNTKK